MPFEASAHPAPANDPLPPTASDLAPTTPEDVTFQAAAPVDIQDLIDTPCRALEVEYKSWRNLDHAEDRAELARDIAALANHGGGFIVFGFDEDTLMPDDTDPFRTNCTQDKVASIVQAYMDPPVPCDVTAPLATSGVVHPVIRIASHGVTPVCIRQDGPVVDGEKLIERA
ncbi:MAG TPA: RNA-binding domain-containing protein, partial [Rhodopila sp.]|nr:RNA-binding domain-containing protein [Rhodopila sp.]